MKKLNSFLFGGVFVLGLGALFVTFWGWPVQAKIHEKTEILTIEYHHPPACPDFNDLNTRPLREEEVEVLFKKFGF